MYNEPHTSLSAISLDVPFHFDFAFNTPRVARYHHTAINDKEWSLKPEDTFFERLTSNGKDWWSQAKGSSGWDGRIYSSSYDQKEYKKLPIYKTRDNILIYNKL